MIAASERLAPDAILSAMKEQIRVVRAVVRNPGLFRIGIAYFGFATAEFATWVAMLVYGYQRGGASTAGAVAAIQLIPCGIVAPFVRLRGRPVPTGPGVVRQLRRARR